MNKDDTIGNDIQSLSPRNYMSDEKLAINATFDIEPKGEEENKEEEGPPQIAYDKGEGDIGELKGFSQLSTSTFFLKHSYRDVGRKKFHFCLSFCSVFMVVWSSLIINTLVERGPIIFLKLAESFTG